MKALAAAALAVVISTACSTSRAPVSVASPSPSSQSSSSPSPSAAEPSPSPTPSGTPSSTTLSCRSALVPGHPLALLSNSDAPGASLVIVDVADPHQPVELCGLAPATGGRFISGTKIAFWNNQQLGSADLNSGAVVSGGIVPSVPSDATFSPDGSLFAYHVGGDTNGMSTHLYAAGADSTLLTRPGIGGHGGSPNGPTEQLRFSADGKYLLAVDSLFAKFVSGPPNFLVYAADGSLAFESSSAEFGTWSPTGHKLYFLAPNRAGDLRGDLVSWDPTGGEATVARRLSSYFWPQVAPDGTSVVFNSYDGAGMPHPWRVAVGSGAATQLSTGVSSIPAFVGTQVIWSDEEQPYNCGPAGTSMPDGKVVLHDLASGHDSLVDLTPFTSSSRPSAAVLDVWL